MPSMGSLRDLRHLVKEFRYLKIYQKKLLKLWQKKKYSINRRKHPRVTELQQITYVIGIPEETTGKKIFEEIVTKILRIQTVFPPQQNYWIGSQYPPQENQREEGSKQIPISSKNVFKKLSHNEDFFFFCFLFLFLFWKEKLGDSPVSPPMLKPWKEFLWPMAPLWRATVMKE